MLTVEKVKANLLERLKTDDTDQLVAATLSAAVAFRLLEDREDIALEPLCNAGKRFSIELARMLDARIKEL